MAPPWPWARLPRPFLPRAHGERSPEPSEMGMGQSHPWESPLAAGRGPPGCVLCQVSVSVPPLQTRGVPSEPPFSTPVLMQVAGRPRAGTLIYFFSLLLLQNIHSHSWKICFLP